MFCYVATLNELTILRFYFYMLSFQYLSAAEKLQHYLNYEQVSKVEYMAMWHFIHFYH